MHINPPKAEHWTVKVVSWLKFKYCAVRIIGLNLVGYENGGQSVYTSGTSITTEYKIIRIGGRGCPSKLEYIVP